jgi:hypothetical protein
VISALQLEKIMTIMTKTTSIKARQPGASGASNEEPAVPTGSTQALLAAPPATGSTPESMIAMAAYYRAERRGFAPGHELEDWFAAEAEITASSLQREAPTAELQ